MYRGKICSIKRERLNSRFVAIKVNEQAIVPINKTERMTVNEA
jgi:hypothetical protein